jgi:hypothetical protein
VTFSRATFSSFDSVRSGQKFQENIPHSCCSETIVAATRLHGVVNQNTEIYDNDILGESGALIMRQICKIQLYGFVAVT